MIKTFRNIALSNTKDKTLVLSQPFLQLASDKNTEKFDAEATKDIPKLKQETYSNPFI
jgi:hypothetical protein